MNADFHYYATYCASILAGYTHKEAIRIAYSSNFVDCCTKIILKKCNAPLSAATTQTAIELADYGEDILSRQEITRIWTSFHFLPGDINKEVKRGSKTYKNKYRLICKPNGKLLADTINLAKNTTLEAIGIAMHILADTWAHQNFAGTPSLVINNVESHIYEIIDDKDYKINFTHNPSKLEDFQHQNYTRSVYTTNENSIMNLGHGRCGHLPDLSFIKYRYLPAWGNYEEITKDNPSDFLYAFSQMVYALKIFKSGNNQFELNTYDNLDGYKEEIISILTKRQLKSDKDWKALANKLSNEEIPDFDINFYVDDYLSNKDKNNTLFNNFIIHALKQKSMIVNRLDKNKNYLAGYSVEYNENGFKGLKDYFKLLDHVIKEHNNGQD